MNVHLPQLMGKYTIVALLQNGFPAIHNELLSMSANIARA